MVLVDKELMNDFVVESQEGLALVETQMLAIEANGAGVDPDVVNGVFRTMHSIKGTAGFLGLDVIGILAHSLEEILDDLRNRELVPNSNIVSTVLRASDVMKGLIDAVEFSNEADVKPLVAELRSLRQHEHEKSGLALASSSAPKLQNQTFAPETIANSTNEVCSDVAQAPKHLDRMIDVNAAALAEFISECRENLDQMDEDLLALDDNPGSRPLLRSLFRTMHTIKGGAGILGMAALENLAHVTEEILAEIRDGKRIMTDQAVTVFLECVERCREGLNLIETCHSDGSFDPGHTLQALKALQATESRGTSPAQSSISVPNPTSTAQGHSQSLGGAVSKNPLVSKSLNVQTVTSSSSQFAGNTPVVIAGQTEESKDPLSTGLADLSTKTATAAAVGESTIRVDVALLDKLMTRVGELVLARNQILQRASNSEDPNFTSTAQRLNLITTELQEGVMKTRMQPIGNVWSKFPRVVRDLASQLSKQVRIEMEGKDTELDKTIIEAIKDPLTHIVRNSVDHGLESPQARVAAGKPSEGLVLLRAYHEGGQVVIEIVDDGKGLDIERIRRKAVERGLITAEQANRISDREATQMILLPGFSTAETVTNISGRGVGMDVVKTNIERIGGTLDIKTEFGKGTMVKIKIPLTLAIIPALIVTSDGDRFAIPQVSLLELVRLEGEHAEQSIEFLNGAPVYRLRGKLLPLVSLSDRLGLVGKLRAGMKHEADQVFNIVVLRANDTHFGLIVDKVNDTEEIVVKPLSAQIKNISEYAGATIMGDGKVALILDVMGLAVAAGLVGNMQEPSRTSATRDSTQNQKPTQTLLVVEGEASRRFALPTCMVSRLETAPVSAIEFADSREVMQYRGLILPLIRLSEKSGMVHTESEEPAEFKVVVYRDQDQSCGLIVERIVDIVETQLELPRGTSTSSHLLGTTVLQDRVTDVLDLRQLAKNRGCGVNAS